MSERNDWDVARTSKNEGKLRALLQKDLPGIKREIARNPEAPIHLLEELAGESSIVILHELAKNENTPDETLKKLTENEDMLVRDYARRTLIKKGFQGKIV